MRFDFRKTLALDHQLDMPAQRCDALGEWREHVERGRARIAQIEADRANAARVQRAQCIVGDRCVDDGDTACVLAELRYRVERHTIVGAVSRWRDDDVALHAQAFLHMAILLDGRVRRTQRRAGRRRKAIVVDMHMAVDRSRGQHECRWLASARPVLLRMGKRGQGGCRQQATRSTHEFTSIHSRHRQIASALLSSTGARPVGLLRVSSSSVATLTSVRIASGISASE